MLWVTAGLVAALIAVIAVMMAESAVKVRSERRPESDSDSARRLAAEQGATLEEAEIRATDGVPLRGWVFKPSAFDRRAVLVLHGFTSRREEMLEHAGLFLRHGYLVLVPDSRGHGASGGSLITFGPLETGDIELWTRWLGEQYGIEEVLGVGQSMGAAMLIQALPRAEQLKAVVAESCYTSFEEAAYERMAVRLRVVPRAASRVLWPVAQAGFWYARARYGVNLRRGRPVDVAAADTRPIFFIHGSADATIPPRHSRILHAACGDRSRHWEVPGAAHTGCLPSAAGEYEERVTRWLAEVGQLTSQSYASRG